MSTKKITSLSIGDAELDLSVYQKSIFEHSKSITPITDGMSYTATEDCVVYVNGKTNGVGFMNLATSDNKKSRSAISANDFPDIGSHWNMCFTYLPKGETVKYWFSGIDSGTHTFYVLY